MGTRHLICVYHLGQFKLAKYCQWDGYPSGSGKSIVEYLTSRFDRDDLTEGLGNLVVLPDKDVKDLYPKGPWTREADKKFQQDYPLLTRDTNGGDVFQVIQDGIGNGPLPHVDSFKFGQDSLFCEWAYVLDLDINTLEVYKGFQETKPKAGKWGKMPKRRGEQYYPIALVAVIPLNATKEEMLKVMDDLEAR